MLENDQQAYYNQIKKIIIVFFKKNDSFSENMKE